MELLFPLQNGCSKTQNQAKNELLSNIFDILAGSDPNKHNVKLGPTPRSNRSASEILQQLGDVPRRRQLAFQRLRQRPGDFVGRHTYRFSGVVQDIFDNRAILLLAENDADGRIFVFLADLPVQRGQVELHLADELRLEFADLQINCDQTAQAAVEQQ